MNELVSFEPEPEDQEDFEPALDTPTDLRPDLSLIGLDEIERGVVEDTAENRRALRGAHMNWDAVYSQTGRPTGLIAARTQEQTKERRVLSLLNNSIEKFKNEISTITEITECYQVTGESDYLIKIMVKDMQAFEKLISDRLSRIEEIGQMKTMMVLSKTKDTRLIPHPYDNK